MAMRSVKPTIPRPVLLGTAAVLVAIMGWAYSEARRDEIPGAIDEAYVPSGELLSERSLRFADRTDGGVGVFDADSGDLLTVVPSGEGSFMRGVLRTFAHERRLHDLSAAEAFKIARWSDGSVALEDPLTGATIDLRAFGVDNVAAFARFLPYRGETS